MWSIFVRLESLVPTMTASGRHGILGVVDWQPSDQGLSDRPEERGSQMFLYKDVDFEQTHYPKKSCTMPRTTVDEAGTPRFLQQALAWVDFQRTALKRQDEDLSRGCPEDLCQTPENNWGSLLL